jgi:hypothetical protein
MALVNGHLRISMHDGLNYKTAVDVYFQAPDTATLAQLRTELAGTVSGFNTVTNCAITDAELRLAVVTPTANTPSTSQKLNDAVGLSYPVPSTGRQWPLVIPSAASGTLSGGVPDMTDGNALDLFADLLEGNMTATGTTSGFYTNNGFQALGAAAQGYLPERKLAKRLRNGSRKLGA